MFLKLTCKSTNHVGCTYAIQIRFEWIKCLTDKGYITTGDGTTHLLNAESVQIVQTEIDNTKGD